MAGFVDVFFVLGWNGLAATGETTGEKRREKQEKTFQNLGGLEKMPNFVMICR